jgi:hypothetical protein
LITGEKEEKISQEVINRRTSGNGIIAGRF